MRQGNGMPFEHRWWWCQCDGAKTVRATEPHENATNAMFLLKLFITFWLPFESIGSSSLSWWRSSKMKTISWNFVFLACSSWNKAAVLLQPYRDIRTCQRKKMDKKRMRKTTGTETDRQEAVRCGKGGGFFPEKKLFFFSYPWRGRRSKSFRR